MSIVLKEVGMVLPNHLPLEYERALVWLHDHVNIFEGMLYLEH